MSNFRDGLVGPTVILLAICLVITFALAGTQTATAQRILEVDAAAANEARADVLTEADTFTQITDVELPEGVMEAYRADNGAGYVFKAGAKGFDGLVTFMVGMDTEGNYTGINMFDHNETPGLGTKVGAGNYLVQYNGQSDPAAVDSITGATRTSNALKNTLYACNEAFELLGGR